MGSVRGIATKAARTINALALQRISALSVPTPQSGTTTSLILERTPAPALESRIYLQEVLRLVTKPAPPALAPTATTASPARTSPLTASSPSTTEMSVGAQAVNSPWLESHAANSATKTAQPVLALAPTSVSSVQTLNQSSITRQARAQDPASTAGIPQQAALQSAQERLSRSSSQPRMMSYLPLPHRRVSRTTNQ